MSVSGTGPYTRIHNALHAANVPEAQAIDAADAILAVKDDNLCSLKTDVSDFKSDLWLLKWQLGVCVALGLAAPALLLRLMLRTGTL